MNKILIVLLFFSSLLFANHSISENDLEKLDAHYSGNYIFYNCEIDLQVREKSDSFQVQIYALDRTRGNELIQNYTVWKKDFSASSDNKFILRNKLEVEGVTSLFNAVFTWDSEKEGELLSMEFTDYQVPTDFASKRRVVCKKLL